MRRVISMLVLSLGLWVAPAVAQTAVNPTTVEFEASADHAAIGLDGAPVLARYELRIYREDGSLVATQDLGKPTPTASGLISLVNRVWFAGLPTNIKYTARVVAIGPYGEANSDASNPFGNAGPPAGVPKPAVKK